MPVVGVTREKERLRNAYYILRMVRDALTRNLRSNSPTHRQERIFVCEIINLQVPQVCKNVSVFISENNVCFHFSFKYTLLSLLLSDLELELLLLYLDKQ